MEELYAINNLEREDNSLFLIEMSKIKEEQDKDNKLKELVRRGKHAEQFNHIILDGTKVTIFNGKVWVPESCQARIIDWYHINMGHPGVTRTYNSIGSTFGWKGIKAQVEAYVNSCDSCQRNKIQGQKKYGKLPLVQALRDRVPWEKIQVDCAGPWTIRVRNSVTGEIVEHKIKILSVVELSTGWPEFAILANSTAQEAAVALDRCYFCRYPRPKECGHDNGPEFLGMEFQEMLQSYGVESKATTVKNPTANGVVERMQLNLGEQLRTKVFDEEFMGDLDTLLQSCAYGIRATHPAHFQYSPCEMAFSHNMIFRERVLIDWEATKEKRRLQALQNNAKQNKNRLVHEYKVGDLVLLVTPSYERKNQPKISPPTSKGDPFKITKIYHEIGIVRIKRGLTTDKVSIRRIKPYTKPLTPMANP